MHINCAASFEDTIRVYELFKFSAASSLQFYNKFSVSTTIGLEKIGRRYFC